MKKSKITAGARPRTAIAVSKKEAILKPKKCGLMGKDKPVAFIIQSPNDDPLDTSTKYSGTLEFLQNLGFGTINKRACDWSMDENRLLDAVKKNLNMEKKPLTIWIDAHGALGWFFGTTDSAIDEYLSMLHFVKCIDNIAQKVNATLVSVVLNGCFTSSEFFNSQTNNFVLSPARMVSLLLPGVQVVGFPGKNSSAKIGYVFEQTQRSEFKELKLCVEEAATLYISGHVVERCATPLYTTHKNTPPFMAKLLDMKEEDARNEHSYYPVLDVVEYMSSKEIKGTGYGMRQLDWITKYPALSAGTNEAEFEEKEESEDEAVLVI